MIPSQMRDVVDAMTDAPAPPVPEPDSVPLSSQEREDSIDSSTLLVEPDTPTDGHAPDSMPADCSSSSSLSTMV